MKPLPHDQQDHFKRALKFMQEANYTQARHELLKVDPGLRDQSLLDQLALCELEIQKSSARELVKKARRCLSKGKPAEALALFEKAYPILAEDWIAQKIEHLKICNQKSDLIEQARIAETARDYAAAGHLYSTVFNHTEEQQDGRCAARCLVKAEQFQQAITLFDSLVLEQDRDHYDFGFALAQTGHFYRCLQSWQKITAPCPELSDQITQVQRLLLDRMYEFEDQECDFVELDTQVRYLLSLDLAQNERDYLGQLLLYCHLCSIKQLWQDGLYDQLWQKLQPWPEQMTIPLIELYAKACFRYVEQSGLPYDDFPMFWLSAIYNPLILRKLCQAGQDQKKVCALLLQKGEELLDKLRYRDDEQKRLFRRAFDVEAMVIEDMIYLIGEPTFCKKLICSPKFANAFGYSQQMINLINKNKKKFKAKEHYLINGAYYSINGPALLAMEMLDYEKARKLLKPVPKSDIYGTFASLIVCYYQGFDELQSEGKIKITFAASFLELFKMSPFYKKNFKDFVQMEHGPEVLGHFEDLLTQFIEIRPLREWKELKSVLMARRVALLLGQNRIDAERAKKVLLAALELYPRNQLARMIMIDIEINLETWQIEKLVGQNRLQEAGRLAVKSRHEKTRQFFTNSIKKLFEIVQDGTYGKARKRVLFAELDQGLSMVYNRHPLLYRIRSALASL